jgi:uncharacterized protein YndB with AHSA1/START domain
VTDSGRAPIVQERLIAASVDVVFAAWRDPSSLSRWMCPSETMVSATVDVDFKVGGLFRIVMHAPDRDYIQEGEYLEIDPPHGLAFTWVSHFMPDGAQQTRVRVTLESAGEDKTRIVLTHDQLPPGDHYDGHVEGWATILHKFSEHLAGD